LLTDDQTSHHEIWAGILHGAVAPKKHKKHQSKRSMLQAETKPSLVAYYKEYKEQIVLNDKLHKFLKNLQMAYKCVDRACAFK